jgi:hypothetical protein
MLLSIMFIVRTQSQNNFGLERAVRIEILNVKKKSLERIAIEVNFYVDLSAGFD